MGADNLRDESPNSNLQYGTEWCLGGQRSDAMGNEQKRYSILWELGLIIPIH